MFRQHVYINIVNFYRHILANTLSTKFPKEKWKCRGGPGFHYGAVPTLHYIDGCITLLMLMYYVGQCWKLYTSDLIHHYFDSCTNWNRNRISLVKSRENSKIRQVISTVIWYRCGMFVDQYSTWDPEENMLFMTPLKMSLYIAPSGEVRMANRATKMQQFDMPIQVTSPEKFLLTHWTAVILHIEVHRENMSSDHHPTVLPHKLAGTNSTLFPQLVISGADFDELVWRNRTLVF